MLFSFGITHAIFIRETPASAYKNTEQSFNISYGNGLQVELHISGFPAENGKISMGNFWPEKWTGKREKFRPKKQVFTKQIHAKEQKNHI